MSRTIEAMMLQINDQQEPIEVVVTFDTGQMASSTDANGVARPTNPVVGAMANATQRANLMGTTANAVRPTNPVGAAENVSRRTNPAVGAAVNVSVFLPVESFLLIVQLSLLETHFVSYHLLYKE